MKTKPMLALAALGVGAVVFSATGRVAAAPNPPQQQDCDRAVDTQRIREALRAQLDSVRTNTFNEVQAQVASALAEKQAAWATTLSGQDGDLRAELLAQVAQAQALKSQMDASPLVWSEEMPQGEDSGWLGVETEGVNADRAKELKLSETRGVYISEVEEESPAEKAGLKSGDVVLEFNGEHVEGTVQFRRLIREIPAGHKVQITVWRDGKSQTVTATLSNVEESMERGFGQGFGEGMGRMSPMPAIAPMPPMPATPRAFSMTMPNIEIYSRSTTPTIGVNAEDIEGQLGNYFGAPDGEGVLVTDVESGSPAEKSGMKAGDVVIKVAGERVRNLNEMRDRLREKREDKTVPVTVLRRGSEQNLTVEPTKPETRYRNTRRGSF
jgi:C-terminal processing protease CtpA/Prc